jgi:hypothetical protein
MDAWSTSEIGAWISWIWDGGYYVAVGDPKQAEGWVFPSIGVAALIEHQDHASTF